MAAAIFFFMLFSASDAPWRSHLPEVGNTHLTGLGSNAILAQEMFYDFRAGEGNPIEVVIYLKNMGGVRRSPGTASPPHTQFTPLIAALLCAHHGHYTAIMGLYQRGRG